MQLSVGYDTTLLSCSCMQTALLHAMVLTGNFHALCSAANPQWGENMLAQGLGLVIRQVPRFERNVHFEDLV